MSLLALISVSVKRKWGSVANQHLVTLLLATFAVFAYRDVWPLATYIYSPLDRAEGPLMWAKLAVLSFVSILIPLLIPRIYTPVNPKVRYQYSDSVTIILKGLL